MSLRKAYESMIENELIAIKAEGDTLDPHMSDEQLSELVLQLSDDDDFHISLTEAIRQFLEDFGENFGL
jgi:hypothetical protein